MPDAVVQDVIAHELAHVVQDAAGPQKRFGYEPSPEELEEEADDMMEGWGFKSRSPDEWAADISLAKRIEVKGLEEALAFETGYYVDRTEPTRRKRKGAE
jgi:hypothetical protein